MSDDLPSDKLNHVTRVGEHFGYPVLPPGRHCPIRSSPWVTNAPNSPRRRYKLGPHVAPLGMKFYTGNQFPAEYKNSIFIAEHGSWNRHKI